jgi:hypothetical protein
MIGSGGVVYSVEGITEGRFGEPITLAAGDLIPPGSYFINAAWQIVIDGTNVAQLPGACLSDGRATATAAAQLVPIGAKPRAVWPWPPPWPL